MNVGQDKINSDYASVVDQSGIKAGDGGFDITVGKHTQLDGAVISSNQKAIDDQLNYFSTGTLDTTEIHNKAEYDATSFGIGGGWSSGKENPIGKDQQGNVESGSTQVPGTELPSSDKGGMSMGTPIALSDNDKVESTTGSSISGGVIEIRDKEAQKDKTGKTAEETLANLDTSVTSEKDGANALEQIFDEDEIKANFEITQAFINEVNTLKANMARKADEAKKAWEGETDPAKKAALYNEYPDALKWAPGGQYSQILTAITSAAGSNVSGSIGEMGTNALINYVQGLGAEQIKSLADSLGKGTAEAETTRALLQGLLACGGAAASGNDCGAGALGAAGSVGLNNLLDKLLNQDTDKMTAEEKLNRENLIGSIIAGIAEGSGLNSNDALTGSNIEMENNYLSQKQVYQLIDELKQCGKDAACAEEKNKKYLAISEKQEKELNATCGVDRSSSACTKLIIDAIGGGNTVLTSADGTSFDFFGKELVEQVCRGLAANCTSILTYHDAINEAAAGYNSSDPALRKQEADSWRVHLSSIGFDSKNMSDDEAIATGRSFAVSVAGVMGSKISGKGNVKLSTSEQKEVRSLSKRVDEHKKKIEEFKANPTIRSGMENLSQDVIKKAQQARINHLEREIKAFQKRIDTINNKGL